MVRERMEIEGEHSSRIEGKLGGNGRMEKVEAGRQKRAKETTK
jgi:hypothetical protein